MGVAGHQALGHKDLHRLAQKARAGIVLDQRLPSFCAVAGLFGEFPLGAQQGVFAGFQLAGRQFPQESVGGMAILPLDNDPWVTLVFGVVDGQDDHAAVVADNVAGSQLAAWFDEAVTEHTEERPLEDRLGAEQFSLLLHRWQKLLEGFLHLGLQSFGFLLRFCLLERLLCLGLGGFFHLGFGSLFCLGFGKFFSLGLGGFLCLGLGGLGGFLLFLGHLLSPLRCRLERTPTTCAIRYRVYAQPGQNAATK